MKARIRLTLGAAVLMAALTLPGLPGAFAAGSAYTVTDLGSLGNTTGASTAFAVNNATPVQVVGGTYTADGQQHAFVWHNGAMLDLGLGAALALNDAGQIVGRLQEDAAGPYAACLWPPNQTLPLPLGRLPGDSQSQATSINAFGQVVGYSSSASLGDRPFLWQDVNGNGLSDPGEMLDLSALLPANSGWVLTRVNALMDAKAIAINDAGQIVGTGTTPSGQDHAFLWTPSTPPSSGLPTRGTITDLGTLGGNSSYAFALNNSSLLRGVGSSRPVGASSGEAFLWTSGATDGVSTNPQMRNLGNLGCSGGWANAINDAAAVQVVGQSFVPDHGRCPSSLIRAFIWDSAHGMRDLNKLIPAGTGWILQRAYGLNNTGKIVGMGNKGAFLLTPK